jgi:hypothetical protein
MPGCGRNAAAHGIRAPLEIRYERINEPYGQLEQVLRVYARHYNRHRPHRSLALRPPEQAGANPKPLRAGPYPQLTGRALLGGLIHEYEHAA